MCFFTTARITQFYCALFNAMGIPVLEMHSRKSQAQRTRAADQFRAGKRCIMFSSDVSARGVDYPDVSLVIQVRSRCLHALYMCNLCSSQFLENLALLVRLCLPSRCSMPCLQRPPEHWLQRKLYGACWLLQVCVATDKAHYVHRLGCTGHAGRCGKGMLLLLHLAEGSFPC